MKANVPPSEEYNALSLEIKDTKGVFARDGALKKFLESRKAAMKSPNLIYAFMNKYTIGDCRKMIDDYARNDGTTWAAMREACGIGAVDPPKALEWPKESDASARRIARLTKLSDSLAAVALGRDTDVQPTPGSLGVLWGK